MRITTDDGVELEVDVRGDGPALVLVHGFTGAKEDFADHVNVLAADHALVMFDHRGHGASDKPDDERAYSLDRLARDTLNVVDALGIDAFVLLGHSMGGMVALRVVTAARERVVGLILLDTSAAAPSGVDTDLAIAAAAIALTEGMEVLKALQDELDPLGTPAHERVKDERPGHEEWERSKFLATAPAAYAGLVRDIVTQESRLSTLQTITCPSVVIVGEQDESFLLDAHAMAGVLPDTKLVVVPDAGHSPQFENPDVYRETMQAFLSRVEAGARS
jgi:pimeloyl-ACP methyl ester carboxylesterase